MFSRLKITLTCHYGGFATGQLRMFDERPPADAIAAADTWLRELRRAAW